MQKPFILRNVFYIYKKQKKSILFTYVFFNPKYWELSWAIEIESCIYEKVNTSVATKLCRNLLNNCRNVWTILVHNTIQWLICVVHYLNVKINWKLVDKITHNFVVHSNESACRISGCLGLEQVFYKFCDHPAGDWWKWDSDHHRLHSWSNPSQSSQLWLSRWHVKTVL